MLIAAADVGGTKTRFALSESDTLRFEERFRSSRASAFDGLLATQHGDDLAEVCKWRWPG